MVKAARTYTMKNNLTIDKILSIKALKTELELERAAKLYRQLRWMVKENPGLIDKRKHLGQLIEAYEEKNWANENEISQEKVLESDLAEMMVERENVFYYKRKEVVRAALKKLNLKQQDLADILGHKKNYMSELINGMRPFSLPDLQIIHQFLKIDLNILIPPFGDLERAEKIAKRIEKALKKKAPEQLNSAYTKEKFLLGETDG